LKEKARSVKMKTALLIVLLLNCFIAAQQPDSIPESLHYKRNDATFLENYNPNDKEKYFPLRSTGVWTELNPNVPRVDYIGVDFINPDTGWAVGLWGAAIKTTNGGQSWQTLETPTGEILLKVHSYNGQVVMAVGHNGTILRSSDGGESFTLLAGITTQELWGVRMLNDTLGWICGRNQTLLKTTDAGLTWQPVVTGFNYHYWQFDFLPAPLGTEDYFMIACSQGKVLKTTDGGQSFTQHQAGSIEDLYTIDIIDSLHIAAAGNIGKNVYSSDGGNTWTENQYTALSINWIQYINRDTGYITIGTVHLHKTTNRGQSWFNPGFGAAGEWQFELLTENLGYGVGAGLTVTKTEDGFITGRNLILNVDFRDVFFFNETTGFALSWFLYKTTDGGLTWERNENAPGGYDILFLDSLVGFIGGTERLFKTTNGGESWYEPNGVPFGIGRVEKIFFINSLTGWAIKSRNILKTSDGGENWVVQFTHPTLGFSSIHFIDSLYGWTSGGRPQKTTDGGITWIEQANTNIWNSDDVYFLDTMNGFIIEFLRLYKTTDSGNSWLNQINSQYIIRNFGWITSDHGFVMGDGVYETNDSGNTWQEILEIRNVGLRKFHAPLNYLGYSVGNQGLIYKYIDSSYIPVELISFNGFFDNEKIILNWETASEINNSGFEIQKSKDKENWYSIGFVQGSGSSTEKNSYSFSDNSNHYEINYYRLKQTDYNGTYEYSNIIEVSVRLNNFQLYQNYPNPFNPITTIKYAIAKKSFIKISLYDIKGEKIDDLINEEKEAGIYTFELNSKNLSSGVYLYRMSTSNGYNSTKKLIIIK
jgi:photosystem II stability/assembly factor-like uncharacterized protein